MARVYVKRMLPAEQELKSRADAENRAKVQLEGVTRSESSTDCDNTYDDDSPDIDVDTDTLQNIMNLEGVTISESTTDEPSYVLVKKASFPNGGHLGGGDQRDVQYDPSQAENVDDQGVMYNVRRKFTNNMEHYSNMLQDMAFPIIFRRREVKEGRNNPDIRQRPQSDFITTATSLNHGDSGPLDISGFEFVENIELHHLDGFVFSSQKERGRGHQFEGLKLTTPTWCDKCGDFIWGVYKQCLRCKSEYNILQCLKDTCHV